MSTNFTTDVRPSMGRNEDLGLKELRDEKYSTTPILNLSTGSGDCGLCEIIDE